MEKSQQIHRSFFFPVTTPTSSLSSTPLCPRRASVTLYCVRTSASPRFWAFPAFSVESLSLHSLLCEIITRQPSPPQLTAYSLLQTLLAHPYTYVFIPPGIIIYPEQPTQRSPLSQSTYVHTQTNHVRHLSQSARRAPRPARPLFLARPVPQTLPRHRLLRRHASVLTTPEPGPHQALPSHTRRGGAAGVGYRTRLFAADRLADQWCQHPRRRAALLGRAGRGKAGRVFDAAGRVHGALLPRFRGGDDSAQRGWGWWFVGEYGRGGIRRVALRGARAWVYSTHKYDIFLFSLCQFVVSSILF